MQCPGTRNTATTSPSVTRGDDRPWGRAVLDTQVVLDWLVFRDIGVRALADAINTRSLRWLTSQAMQDELEHVLDRGVAASWQPDRRAIAAAFDTLAVRIVASAPLTAPLRCSDPDDQMFIDLALTSGVQWLFTRDLALLRLAPRALERGVTVLRPADWQPSTVSRTQK